MTGADAFVDARDASMVRSADADRTVVEEREHRASPGEWSDTLEPFGAHQWELPGRGDHGAGCGVWYPDAVCETCGEPRFKARVCGARSCPDCWGVWAQEAAVRATQRIQSYRHTQPPDWHRQAAHAVVSPPEGDVRTAGDYWRWRSKAADIASEKGWRGFAVIPHPYRPTDEAKQRYRRADPDYGIWVWLRNDVRHMYDLIKWSPHYHIVGMAGADMDPAKESESFVYHWMRSTEPYSGIHDSDSHEDLYGLFRYLLSHTGYPAESSKQVTTWYGDLANSVFVEEATEDWQHPKPSEGVRSALQREIEEVAGAGRVEDNDDRADAQLVDDDSCGDCPVDECSGVLIDAFDVSSYLIQNDPPPDERDKMEVVRDWRLGRVEPPPGLKLPQSEQDAVDAFDAIVDGLE